MTPCRRACSSLWTFLACTGVAFVTNASEAMTAPLPSQSPHGVSGVSLPDIDVKKMAIDPGLQVRPLADSWISGDLKALMAQRIADQRRHGYYIVEESRLPGLAAAVAVAKTQPAGGPFLGKRYASLQSLRAHLHADPISLGGSLLAGAPLLDAGTAGGLVHGHWTGAERYFDVPELGIVMLEEQNMALVNGSIGMIEEWINADVNGRPAVSTTKRSPTGRTLVSVAWNTHEASYVLRLEPLHPEELARNQSALLDIARKLGR
jgi:hypothetical protein